MKTSFALALAGAAFVAAQTQLTDLPQCGQTCIGNMINIAQSQFGCAANNVTCFCTKQDFGYGVRDCSDESCPGGTNVAQIIQFAVNYCAAVLPTPTPNPNAVTALTAPVSGASSASDSSSTGTDSGSASSTATVTSTVSSGAEGATGAAGIVAVNGGTSGYAFGSSTITAGGPDITVSGTEYSALPSGAGVAASMVSGSMITTISGSSALGAVAGVGAAGASATDSAGSAASSAASSATSGASSVASSAESGASSITGSAGSAISSISASASSAASSLRASGASATSSVAGVTSSAAGVMQTAAPALFGAAAFALLVL